MSSLLRGSLDGGAPSQNDDVLQRHLLLAAGAVDLLLIFLERRQNLRQLGWLVGFPTLLRRKADACPVGPAAFVAAAEARRRGPGGGHQLRDRQPRGENFRL